MQKVLYFKGSDTWDLNKMLKEGWELETIVPARINERGFIGDCASYAILRKEEDKEVISENVIE